MGWPIKAFGLSGGLGGKSLPKIDLATWLQMPRTPPSSTIECVLYFLPMGKIGSAFPGVVVGLQVSRDLGPLYSVDSPWFR